jgi:hypothetical protein
MIIGDVRGSIGHWSCCPWQSNIQCPLTPFRRAIEASAAAEYFMLTVDYWRSTKVVDADTRRKLDEDLYPRPPIFTLYTPPLTFLSPTAHINHW